MSHELLCNVPLSVHGSNYSHLRQASIPPSPPDATRLARDTLLNLYPVLRSGHWIVADLQLEPCFARARTVKSVGSISERSRVLTVYALHVAGGDPSEQWLREAQQALPTYCIGTHKYDTSRCTVSIHCPYTISVLSADLVTRCHSCCKIAQR